MGSDSPRLAPDSLRAAAAAASHRHEVLSPRPSLSIPRLPRRPLPLHLTSVRAVTNPPSHQNFTILSYELNVYTSSKMVSLPHVPGGRGHGRPGKVPVPVLRGKKQPSYCSADTRVSLALDSVQVEHASNSWNSQNIYHCKRCLSKQNGDCDL